MSRVFVFPGQGSQETGMGQGFPSSERIWKKADSIIGFDLSRIVKEGSEEELTATRVTQPAVYVAEIVILEEFNSKGITPDAVAGHSLGEYAAAVASGALSWEDGLRIVGFRGRLFEETAAKNPGGMAAVIGLDENDIDAALRDIEGVSQAVNFNSPGQVVVSVQKDLLETALERLKSAGAKMVIPLKVSGGFHSSLMDDAVEPMSKKLDEFEFKAPRSAFYSNATARRVTTPEGVKESLAAQVNSPVLWSGIIESIISDFGEEALFIEAGPGKVLQGLLRRINRRLKGVGVSSTGDLESLSPGSL